MLFPPRTEVGISPTLTPSKFVAAALRQTRSVHVEVGPPLIAEIVTGVASLVAVGDTEAVGITPTFALSSPVAATDTHTRSVHVVLAPFVETTIGWDRVLEAAVPPSPRDRLKRPPLDDGSTPTPKPRPPTAALRYKRSLQVAVGAKLEVWLDELEI